MPIAAMHVSASAIAVDPGAGETDVIAACSGLVQPSAIRLHPPPTHWP